MDNKEIKEMIKGMKEVLELLNSDNFKEKKDKFEKMLNEALDEPCKITIEKGKDGACRCGIEGRRLSLLIALAGAKKDLLKQLHCSDEEFEFISKLVGTRQADEEVL